MKIALAQIECAVGDVPANCCKIKQFVSQAAAKGCSLVVLPEMADTGYDTAVIPRTAQPWPGPAYDCLAAAAREYSIHIIGGLSEREGQHIYNSIGVFGPDGGLLARYRKMHLFTPEPACEDRCFSAGSEAVVQQIAGVGVGLSICYDLRFPELYRLLALRGARVLIHCTAWPASRAEQWDHLTRARAIENQAFFVGVDHAGADGPIAFCGHSRIVAPRGIIVAEAPSREEQLICGEIDMTQVDEFRREVPALASRRGDVYGEF